jgi:lysophospholipase L1-like esterase
LKFLQETQPNAKVILLTPSTVDMAAWTAFGREQGMPSEFSDNRSPEAAKQIRDVVLDVAKEADVGVVDVWKLHDDAVNRGDLKTSELFTDGLHYSEKGYAVSITLLSVQAYFEA